VTRRNFDICKRIGVRHVYSDISFNTAPSGSGRRAEVEDESPRKGECNFKSPRPELLNPTRWPIETDSRRRNWRTLGNYPLHAPPRAGPSRDPVGSPPILLARPVILLFLLTALSYCKEPGELFDSNSRRAFRGDCIPQRCGWFSPFSVLLLRILFSRGRCCDIALKETPLPARFI